MSEYRFVEQLKWPTHLPLDVTDLQSLFTDQLLEQVKLANHRRFGVRSEYISLDRLRLLLEEKDAEDIPENLRKFE